MEQVDNPDGGLPDILSRLQAVAEKHHNNLAVQMLTEVKEKLAAQVFTLVVLGEFKRGKSTLINALLGTNLLPTGILPLTSVPTVIRYGPVQRAWVVFLTDNRQEIDYKDIAPYVTEKDNPHNIKQVRQVELEYPSPYLQTGMILVDTPGIGSAYQHNTTAAYAYLPHGDAALMLTAVDAPLSQVELDYLQDIRAQVPALFFVLNKIDTVPSIDVAEVVQFTQEILQGNLNGEKIILIPLSARQALESKLTNNQAMITASGWPELEQVIADLIAVGKTKLIRKVAASKGLRIAQELTMVIRLWQQARQSDAADLETKIKRFNETLSVLRHRQEENIYLLYHEVAELGREVSHTIEQLPERRLPGLRRELQDYFEGQLKTKTSGREMVPLLNQFIRERLETVLTAWQRESQVEIHQRFVRIAHKFFDRIEEIVENMLAASAEIFAIKYETATVKNYIFDRQEFYFHFDEHPTFMPSMENLVASGLLPGFLLKGSLYKHSLTKLEELFDRNCGRLRYDLTEGLKENARSVVGELRQRADMVAEGLQQALTRAQQEKQEGQTSGSLLEAVTGDLNDLQAWQKGLTSYLDDKD